MHEVEDEQDIPIRVSEVGVRRSGLVATDQEVVVAAEGRAATPMNMMAVDDRATRTVTSFFIAPPDSTAPRPGSVPLKPQDGSNLARR
jgi:hypothetical protein